MKWFNILVAAIAGIVLVAAAPTVADGANILMVANKTYSVVDIDWSVQMNNTAAPYNLTVTGTIQDVLDHISSVDLSTADVIREAINANNSSRAMANTNADAGLLPAHEMDLNETTRYCNVDGWGACSTTRITQGIQYLAKVPGEPANGPGPGACGRVSCSYGASIWWCNDSLEEKVLDHFQDIGDGAAWVMYGCSESHSYGDTVQGQQFFEDGWNVIVRHDSC